MPVVRAVDGTRRLSLLRWGLVPAWAKDAAIGDKPINARAETIAEKPSFKAAFRARRCLVAADGFYEWRRDGRVSQPFRIEMRDRAPFAMAGLWERWTGEGREALETFALITTEANDVVAPIHHRMPVILEPRRYGSWLDPHSEFETLTPLFQAYSAVPMHAYPISRAVNNPKKDSPEILVPVPDQGRLL
jgi:putative SOS response-associated peptidase YedK